jgi:hypothetical protein
MAHEEFLRRLRQMSIRLRHLPFASISSLSGIVNNSLLRPAISVCAFPRVFHILANFKKMLLFALL